MDKHLLPVAARARCVARHLFVALPLLLATCASDPYVRGTGRNEIDRPNSPVMEQQILVGEPYSFLDASDWIWPGSLLGKLLLWDRRVDSHSIDPETIARLQEFIDENELENVQVHVNYYGPGNQWKRLFNNRTVGAGWRYTLGVLSVVFYTILPGRFFGGDAFNPYTNTIYLYSDIPAIALHEAGHSKEFGSYEHKGTNAAIYMLPLAALYYEAGATGDALGYLQDRDELQELKQAYEILYPAYTTYVFGSFSQFAPSPLWMLGVIPGHIAGQIASSEVDVEEPPDDAESTR